MSGMRTLDWYEDELERDDLPEDLREKYEAEAARLAAAEQAAKLRIKQRKLNEEDRLNDIRERLKRGDESVIDLVGIPEFGGDYELTTEGDKAVIYSDVALENQENRHVHDTMDEAVRHYRKLVWDRLYTKYVRSGELDSLKQME